MILNSLAPYRRLEAVSDRVVHHIVKFLIRRMRSAKKYKSIWLIQANRKRIVTINRQFIIVSCGFGCDASWPAILCHSSGFYSWASLAIFSFKWIHMTGATLESGDQFRALDLSLSFDLIIMWTQLTVTGLFSLKFVILVINFFQVCKNQMARINLSCHSHCRIKCNKNLYTYKFCGLYQI